MVGGGGQVNKQGFLIYIRLGRVVCSGFPGHACLKSVLC